MDAWLSSVAAMESRDPTVPDSIDVRVMRGLFFVHLYGAFEYAVDQAFVRVAQYISAHPVSYRHLQRTIFSVAMEDTFKSIHDIGDWKKKFEKRIDLINGMTALGSATIPDNVLSRGMESLDPGVISLGLRIYGLKDEPFVDLRVRGYIDEVVSKRHAVAHGRESPVAYGNMRTNDLRKRYDALYQQSTYMLDVLTAFLIGNAFIATRSQRRYAGRPNAWP